MPQEINYGWIIQFMISRVMAFNAIFFIKSGYYAKDEKMLADGL